MSQSRWSRPSIASRTAPPTHHASCPARSTLSTMWSTAGGGEKRPAACSPTEHRAAVHVHNLTGDVARERRAQKHDRTGDIVGTRDASDGNRFRDPLAAAVHVFAGRHVRVDPP